MNFQGDRPGGVRTTLRGIMGSRISCFERRWRHFGENMVSLDVYSRYVSLIFILLIKLLIKFNSYNVNYCILFIVFGEREYKTSCTRAACYLCTFDESFYITICSCYVELMEDIFYSNCAEIVIRICDERLRLNAPQSAPHFDSEFLSKIY